MALVKPAELLHESMHASRDIYNLLIDIKISTRNMKFKICARREACAQAGSGWRPVSRALYMHARDMACCMHIADSMKDAAHMLSMHHSMHRGHALPSGEIKDWLSRCVLVFFKSPK